MLETEIAALEARKNALEALMSSGALTNEELVSSGDEMGRLIDEIDEKTLRWLELSELA